MSEAVNEDGERVIRGTRRPDGTYRKDVKVRAGYTPQDEQPVYVPRGAQVAYSSTCEIARALYLASHIWRTCNNAITVLLIMQALMGAPKVPGMSENGGLPVCLHHLLLVQQFFLCPSFQCPLHYTLCLVKMLLPQSVLFVVRHLCNQLVCGAK